MPLAAILGCAGPELTAAEAAFFKAHDPLGFIVFARNLVDPDQARRLTADLRASIGRPDAPILVDQEGGRVARLKAPHWRHPPAADTLRRHCRDRPCPGGRSRAPQSRTDGWRAAGAGPYCRLRPVDRRPPRPAPMTSSATGPMAPIPIWSPISDGRRPRG